MSVAEKETNSAVCFGDCRFSQGTLGTDKRFTGQRLDNTGLYYYGARYYDPMIGRFISADTIVLNKIIPQALNRYSYCLNNPLKYIDPSGNIVTFMDYAIGLGGLPMCGWEQIDPSVYKDAATLREAFSLVRESCPELTNNMETSDMQFLIQSNNQMSEIGLTTYYKENTGNVEININLSQTKSMKSIASALAHESIHACIAELEWKEGIEGTYSSKYEEVIAFQFQHKVNKTIGWDPGPHNPWSFCWRSSEQSANEIVRKSLWVNLSNTPSSLGNKLNDALFNTSYRYLRPLPEPEYFGIMTSTITSYLH